MGIEIPIVGRIRHCYPRPYTSSLELSAVDDVCCQTAVRGAYDLQVSKFVQKKVEGSKRN